MTENSDQVALGWVREEIARTLEQSRQALEAFFENNEDITQLQICIRGLHQVKGTLQILGFPGAIALADEIEQFGLALESKEVEISSLALEVLMGGILQLNLYLKKIQTGQQDLVFLLLPAINEFRQLRNLELFTSDSFELMASSITPPKPSSDFELPETPEAFSALTKKLRHHFQRGLLGVLKQENIPQSLQRIHKVLERLEALCYGHRVSHLWWIADGFVGTLREKGLQDEKTAKVLLGQIDKQIKRLAELGEKALGDEISQSLLHSLLENIYGSKVENTRLSQIREAFAMDVKTSGVSNTAFAGASEEAMEVAADELKENIANVKDSIDLFVRNKVQDSASAEQFLPKLKQVIDTLELLGLEGMRANLIQQTNILKQKIEETEKIDGSIIMDIAGALLIIEASLSDLRNAQQNINIEEVQKTAQESEHLQAQYQFVREARINIQRAQDSIVDFMASNGEQNAILEVPIWLADAEGGFNILAMPKIEHMIKSCRKYVENRMLNEKKLPPHSELDALADVLTSVEYYLEGFTETGNQSLGSILFAAEQSLSILQQKSELAAFAEDVPKEETQEETIETSDVENIAGKESVVDDSLVDDEILEIFIEEAEDELASLKETLPQWRSNPEDSEALITSRRSFHTLKGSGRLVGATAIGELAWSVESLLNKIIAETHIADEDVFSAFFEVVALLPQLIEAFANGKVVSEDAEQLASRIEHLGARAAPAKDAELPQPVSEEEKLTLAEEPLENIFTDDTQMSKPQKSVSEEVSEPVEIQPIEVEDEIELSDQIEDAVKSEALIELDFEQLDIESKLSEQSELVPENNLSESEQTEKLDLEKLTLAEVDDDKIVMSTEKPTDLAIDLNEVISEQEEVPLEFTNLAEDVGNSDDELKEATKEIKQDEIISEQQNVAILEPALLEIFTAEIITHLETIDSFIETAKENDNEILATDEVVRALHTIKGSAKMTGSRRIADIIIPLEEHYRQLNGRIVSVTSEALDVLASSSKYLNENIDDLEKLEQSPVEDHFQMLLNRAAELEALIPPLEFEKEGTEGDAIINFLEDAQDSIDEITDIIDNWKLTPENREIIQPVIIGLTSISIRAGELNFDPISVHTNKIITLLNKAFDKENYLDESFFNLLVKSIAFITENFDRIAATQRPKIDQDLLQQLDVFEFPATQIEDKQLDKFEPSVVEDIVEDIVEKTVEEDIVETIIDEEKELADKKVTVQAKEDIIPLNLDKDDVEILDIYLEEARELIDEQEDTLQLWAEDLSNQQHLQLLLRQLHTLKGGARLSGVTNLANLSHELETIFEAAVSGRIKADSNFLELATSGRNHLDLMLNEITENSRLVSANQLISQLKAFARGEKFILEEEQQIPVELQSESKSSKTGKRIPENVIPLERVDQSQKTAHAKTKVRKNKTTSSTKNAERVVPQVREMIRVGAETLEGLVNLAGETSIYRSRLQQQVTNFRFNLEEITSTVDRVKNQLRNLEIETEAQVEYRQERINEYLEEDFDPLEMDRYTRQQELTRGLGESTTDLISLKDTLDGLASDAEVLLLQQSRVDSELQDRLMKTRLVAFSGITPRLRRMTRQISEELNKKVQLSIKAEGEMDRTILERLISPIEHMVRNAIDHGIESTSKRKKARKPTDGRVLIRLFREGSEVVIEVIDDGRGIDLAAVRNIAVEKGLILPDADLADHELMMMILEAGFSTATEVTQISGRGVGMDVVNNEIKQMGGKIDIASIPGKGSTFTVRLPFTVSVNQALMIASGEDLFAIPLTNIEGIVRVSPYELVEYYEMERPEFVYAGESYQLRYMGKILDIEEKPRLEGVTQPIPLLLLHGAEHPVALQVDELLGSREIVVKSVGTQLSNISGIAGATILGDGSVVLILDLPAMLRRIDTIISESGVTQIISERKAVEEKPLVMVVDDSITVRKVTSRLLERNDYEVITAKDGVDAVSVISDRIPDIILLDIEMPRMDGFELATIIRHDEKMKNLPIVMITSRTGDKHKNRATEIGVNEFMGKPFNEVDLLNMIEDLIGQKG